MNRKRMKVLTAVVLTLVLLLSCLVAYGADVKTYDYAKEYTDKQGPVWFYEYNDGSGYKDIQFYKQDWMTWTAAENCKGPDGVDCYVNVYNDSGNDLAKLHPDLLNGKPTEAVIAWKAPADGKVTIAKATFTHNSYGNAGSDGVDVAVKTASKTLFSAYVGNGKSVDQPEITVNVKAGDKIYFAAGIHEKNGSDEVGWQLNLKFEEGAAAAAETTAAANPKTGDSGTIPYILLALAAAALLGILVYRNRKAVRS